MFTVSAYVCHTSNIICDTLNQSFIVTEKHHCTFAYDVLYRNCGVHCNLQSVYYCYDNSDSKAIFSFIYIVFSWAETEMVEIMSDICVISKWILQSVTTQSDSPQNKGLDKYGVSIENVVS
jgi:hypothetical protein